MKVGFITPQQFIEGTYMNDYDSLKVWYVEYYRNDLMLCDTKLCSRNYISAKASACKEARLIGGVTKIRLENSDNFKVYTVDIGNKQK